MYKRQVFISGSQQVKVLKTDHKGPTKQGVVAAESSDLEFKFIEVGKWQAYELGVGFANATDSKVKWSRFENLDVAIWSAYQTQGIEVKRSRFEDNTCDIKVTDGALDPDLDDNNPHELIACP